MCLSFISVNNQFYSFVLFGCSISWFCLVFCMKMTHTYVDKYDRLNNIWSHENKTGLVYKHRPSRKCLMF